MQISVRVKESHGISQGVSVSVVRLEDIRMAGRIMMKVLDVMIVRVNVGVSPERG